LIESSLKTLLQAIPNRAIFFRLTLGLAFLCAMAGCGEQDEEKAEYGYITAPTIALRDRVAAVYNKVAFLNNGDRVRILERSGNKRFVRVRAENGKEGWLPQRYLAGQDVYDGFQQLAQQNAGNTSQATAITRRVVNMHVTPEREGPTLFQLKEGERLELLKRTATPKDAKAVAPKPPEPTPNDEDKDKAKEGEDEDTSAAAPAKATTKGKAAPPVPAVPMEDWWLVRDSRKRVGWMLGRMIDVEVPLEVAQYAEGQRIVASHVLNEVPEHGSSGDKQHAQYAVLLSEPKDGMPFDFNQVRVFTWNPKRDRYETAYRERVIGHLPFKVGKEEFGKEGLLPTFAMTVEEKDGNRAERKYKMSGPIVRRVTPATENSKKPPQSTKKTAGR